MIHKLAHALAMKQHGIVYPSNFVHVSTYPLALAALSQPKPDTHEADSGSSFPGVLRSKGDDKCET